MLGPMTNPARSQSHLVGVFNTEVQKIYSEVYQLAGIKHGIVYSFDGYDEISLTGEFSVVSNNIATVYTPEKLGFLKTNPAELHGGNSIEEAANIFTSILQGKGTKAQNEVVIANSAFALCVYFPQHSIEECIAMAKDSLMGGKALNIFKKLLDK
jgi:anthranilate phosphoribosyltransferase